MWYPQVSWVMWNIGTSWDIETNPCDTFWMQITPNCSGSRQRAPPRSFLIRPKSGGTGTSQGGAPASWGSLETFRIRWVSENQGILQNVRGESNISNAVCWKVHDRSWDLVIFSYIFHFHCRRVSRFNSWKTCSIPVWKDGQQSTCPM